MEGFAMRRSNRASFASCLTLLCAFAAPTALQTLASEAIPTLSLGTTQSYARVALDRDKTRILTLGFARSAASSRPFDRLYADANLDGKIEVSEKVEHVRHVKGKVEYFEFLLQLPCTYIEDGQPASSGSSLRVISGFNAHVGGVYLRAWLAHRFRREDREWQYCFWSDLEIRSTSAAAPVMAIEGSSSVRVRSQKDRDVPGAAKLFLEPIVGTWRAKGVPAWVTSGEQRFPSVALTITGEDGKSLHEGTAGLDRFEFG